MWPIDRPAAGVDEMPRIIRDDAWRDIERDLHELALYRATGMTPDEIRAMADGIDDAPDILPLWADHPEYEPSSKIDYMA